MFGVGIIALLTVLGLSLIITRVATVALSLTGLSYETARFQARSAYTGTGFTTKESENVVSHPVRRQIIMILGINRDDGSYVGAPRPNTDIHAGDTLIIYGRTEGLKELDQRHADTAGDQAHENAKQKQQQELRHQQAQEERYHTQREKDQT